MADLGEMRVKVGADISGLLSKVDAAKAKLGQLVESQQGLKEKINDVNTSLRLNEKELTAANVKLQALNTSSKEGKTAAAALRTEIAQLAKNSALLNTELTTAKDTLATTTAEIKVQTVAVKQAENAHTGFAAGATKVYSGLRKLAYIIPGMGIAGLISLISGPVIDAFSEWFDSINQVSDALKTMQANQANLNDIYSESNKEASKQITDLQILYKAATDVTLSMKDRLAAVKGLQNEFPDYFKNLKTENILNGSSKGAYDALTESIIKTARAKAAIGKLDEIAAKQLDNDIQRQKIINATTNEAARAKDRVLKQQTSGSSLTGGASGGSEVTITRAEQLKVIEARRDAALKIVDINAKTLKDQADFITKFIGLNDLAKGVETEIKTPKVKKDTESVKNVETISDILQKLGIQIDFLNQKELLLKTSEAQAKVNAIESAINTLMQKFRLQANDPIIIKLEAQVQDINLTEQFKKVLKGDKGEKLTAPIDLKPEIKPDYQAFDSDRYNLIKKLKGLGVTKTKIGIPIDTANIKELNDTLTETQKKLAAMADFTVSTLSPAFDALFEGILSGSQNAFQSFGQALEQTIVKLGAAVLKAAAFAAILSMIEPGATFGGEFKKLLGFSQGGSVKGFASGGLINGPGTKTSDSILARLSKGEFIIRADTVSKFGVGFFDKLNKGMIPKFDPFGIPKFAVGGFVSPNVIRAAQIPSLSGISIGGGQTINIKGDFQLRNDRLVAAVSRGTAQINRNS